MGDTGFLRQAKRPRRLPTVWSPADIQTLFAHLHGWAALTVRLMCSTGLRVMDPDFDYRQILVHRGKGGKDRSASGSGLRPLLEQQAGARRLSVAAQAAPTKRTLVYTPWEETFRAPSVRFNPAGYCCWG